MTTTIEAKIQALGVCLIAILLTYHFIKSKRDENKRDENN